MEAKIEHMSSVALVVPWGDLQLIKSTTCVLLAQQLLVTESQDVKIRTHLTGHLAHFLESEVQGDHRIS